MSKPYLSYRAAKENPYTKRLALLRSLPIPVSVLSLSRTIFMIMTLMTMSVAYYLAITVALPNGFFETVSITEYLLFILFWFGYALALAGMNPFMEYGTNGKILHTIPFVFLALLFAAAFFVYPHFDQGIVSWSFGLIREYGIGAVLLSLFAGVVGCFLWNRLLTIRLAKRDYM